MSDAEDLLALHLQAARLTGWQREFRFLPPRRWRFDFAWPAQRLAVEVDGGVWIAGRHSGGTGQEADNAKLAAAAIAGWRVIRVSPGQIQQGLALTWIEQALGAEGVA